MLKSLKCPNLKRLRMPSMAKPQRYLNVPQGRAVLYDPIKHCTSVKPTPANPAETLASLGVSPPECMNLLTKKHTFRTTGHSGLLTQDLGHLACCSATGKEQAQHGMSVTDGSMKGSHVPECIPYT